MNRFDALLDVLYKIYYILQHYHATHDQMQKYPEDKQMDRQDVKDYLGISESTYKRKVKDGSLRPLRLPGGDRFYKSQLEEQYKESIRRGRI
ncbi:DNA-binding protein [Pedobacter sp.]|uniref:DNA-binding protein n=1 Tax=Pedobacter sp. TaxID=1411316 RepID=UPI003C35DBD7